MTDELARLCNGVLGVPGEECSVLRVHARQGRVTPYLGEDDAHGEGYVAGASQHPAQGERVPSPAVGGQAD